MTLKTMNLCRNGLAIRGYAFAGGMDNHSSTAGRNPFKNTINM